MSADNTVMILCTAGEYRVAHVQNAEDVLDNDSNSTVNVPNWTWIRPYFDKARVFKSHDQAFGYAMRLEEELDFVEYGIETVTFTEAYPVDKQVGKVRIVSGEFEGEIVGTVDDVEILFTDDRHGKFRAPLSTLLHSEWKRRIVSDGTKITKREM